MDSYQTRVTRWWHALRNHMDSKEIGRGGGVRRWWPKYDEDILQRALIIITLSYLISLSLLLELNKLTGRGN